ncbi:HAD family hydrolase [Tetragenococcus koreensis]|uniref:HAD family hydrolase n=1 Tax=Tetragenococcus koreensis TaxID=290335 RepID=UPI001F2D0195|nr:HAD family hydrolase [Tetragenococcus koreensis]MCF1618843.1 HAD family hydrolase [Tetragenococcus koreensis]MCF1656324.1 HAD family hydrolase [Tetragenococcus koreensis]
MQAIFFDVDDTLYDQLRPFARAFEKHFNFSNIPLETLYTTSRKLSDEVFQLVENGQMDMQEMHVYRIKHALAYFGKKISNKEAVKFQRDYQFFQEEITLLPDVIDALNFCSQNEVTMGIITNGPLAHQKRKIKQLGVRNWIPKENIIISSEVGLAKPDVRIFHLAESKIQSANDQVYYVGDSFQNDIIGARNAGWKAIWCNRRYHKKPLDTVKPDYVITGKTELFETVREIVWRI